MTQPAQNVDPDEIAKFARLAARWWDPHSEFKPLHDLNPLRLKFIDERAPLKGKRVVDIGCGGGILTESMAALGANVWLRLFGVVIGSVGSCLGEDFVCARECVRACAARRCVCAAAI